MNASSHFDVIIIGSGAGGGTLALRLAPSGKRILILERGGIVAGTADSASDVAIVYWPKWTAPRLH